MRIDAFSQFIVPLIFLAVWAITSLLNRNGQPLPPRPNRPQPRPGPPGPGSRRDAFTTQPDDAAPAVGDEASTPPRRPGFEPYDPRSPERPRQLPGRPSPSPIRSGRPDGALGDDDVIFVEAARRPVGGAPPPSAPRKPTRGKRSEQPAARTRRGAPETQRALSEQIGQAMSQNRGQQLTLSPINAKLANLSSASLRDASATAATVTSNDAPPTLSAVDVRRLMADGARLREMAILAEVLQPPISRRPRRLG